MNAIENADREVARECMTAMDVLRTAKNAFFWLAVVAIVLHLFAWFGAAPAQSAASNVLEAETQLHAATSDSARSIGRVLESRLTLIGFVGRASVLVCAGIFIICLLVSLAGRLGGTVGFTKACVWSLVSLAMVMPWVGPDVRQTSAFRSAFFDGDELYGFGDGFVALIRFVVCPLLVLACLFLAQLQFRTAFRRVMLPAGGKLPIHEV